MRTIAEALAERRAIELGEASRRMGHQILGALLPICSVLESLDDKSAADLASAARKAAPARGATDYLRALGRSLQLLNPQANDLRPEAPNELHTLLTTVKPLLELALAPRVRLEWRVPPSDVATTTPRTLLAQTLFHLCLMARDRRPEQKLIEIDSVVEHDNAVITITAPAPERDQTVAAPDADLFTYLDARLRQFNGGVTHDASGRIHVRIAAANR